MAMTVESPASIRLITRPRIQTGTPGKCGSPVGRRRQIDLSANLSIPLAEHSRAMWSCRVPRRWTTRVAARRIVGALEERPEIEKTINGGSALTEKTDVAV